MDPSDEYLTVESAGSAAGISPRTLRSWIKGGKLPATAGPRGTLVRLGDVLALADLTGRTSPQAAATRQAAGHSATSATSAAGSAGNVADGGDNAPTAAVSPAARSQLEAIRDEWLAPLVAQIREQAEEIGALRAERDALAADRGRLAAEVARDRGLADQLVDLLQEERDALRWERDRLAEQIGEAPSDWRALTEATAERDTLRAEVERLRGTQGGPLASGAATGAADPPDPDFQPSVAAWRERTTRAVDLDPPAAAPPWWRFWGRRR